MAEFTRAHIVGDFRIREFPDGRAVCIIPSIAENNGVFGYRVMLRDRDGEIMQFFLTEDAALGLAEMIYDRD